MAHYPKFDVVAAVKDNSRVMFKDMPKQKAIKDKRRKKPRFKEKWDE